MSAVDVQGLRIAFGDRAVVDDVSFTVEAGECVAIVGESGAGKSLSARALLGLLPGGASATTERLHIAGTDAARLGESGWRTLRGRRIALVSQDALAALDPLRRIGREVAEPMEIHGLRADGGRVLELLESVSMPDAERRVRSRPQELSGGLRQRALIASALWSLSGGTSVLTPEKRYSPLADELAVPISVENALVACCNVTVIVVELSLPLSAVSLAIRSSAALFRSPRPFCDISRRRLTTELLSLIDLMRSISRLKSMLFAVFIPSAKPTSA